MVISKIKFYKYQKKRICKYDQNKGVKTINFVFSNTIKIIIQNLSTYFKDHFIDNLIHLKIFDIGFRLFYRPYIHLWCIFFIRN